MAIFYLPLQESQSKQRINSKVSNILGFPGGQCKRRRKHRFDPWVGKISWRRKWQPTPVFLPGKPHGWKSLLGCSPWGCEESYTTARLHFHFSLSCIGEGNGNPLQCSCLENPRDGWAAVYGVAQSRTRLKRLSSSSGEFVCIIAIFSYALNYLSFFGLRVESW